MSKILILTLLLIFSFSTCASYTPVTTKGSSDVTDVRTFKIRAPNIGITHSGSIATLGIVGMLGGGSSKAITPVNGGVLWTDADSFEVIPAGTSGQLLKSNGAAAPSWINAPASSTNKECKYAFGGVGSTLANPTVCSAGACVEIHDSCGTGTPPSFLAAGTYGQVNIAAGTFQNSSYIHCSCTANLGTGGGSRICVISMNTSVSPMVTTATGAFLSMNIFTYAGTTASNAAVQISCTGIAP